MGTPVATRIDRQIDFDWNSAAPVAAVKQDAFSVRWTSVIVPPETGPMTLSMRLAHCYPCRNEERFTVKVDGKVVDEFGTDGKEFRESAKPRFTVSFTDPWWWSISTRPDSMGKF